MVIRNAPVQGVVANRGPASEWARRWVPPLLALLLLVPSPCYGQEEDQRETWNRLQYFLGTWKGRETGKAGLGEGDRAYAFVMDGKYLAAVNTSTFEPQDMNPEGELHEDWALFSYDRLRGKIILREFHSEGFVNQYILQTTNADDRRLVFLSENIENLPPGWRARITLTIRDDDSFDETFELAAPGEEYELLLENYWTRSVNGIAGGM